MSEIVLDLAWKREKVLEKTYSAHIHLFHHVNYANVDMMRKHGYASMPLIGYTTVFQSGKHRC